MWTLKKTKTFCGHFIFFNFLNYIMWTLTEPYAIVVAACVIYYVNCTDLSHVGQKITWGTNITLILQITLYFLRLKIWCIRDKNWQVLPIGLQHLHLFWFKSSVTQFSYNASLTVWKTHMESHVERDFMELCFAGLEKWFFFSGFALF